MKRMYNGSVVLKLLLALIYSAAIYGQSPCGAPIGTFPYSENFEASPAWTSGGTNNDWAWGTPAHPSINTAGGGTKSWCLGGLSGSFYAYSEQCWLVSPCFDFTTLNYPWISFKIFWECERQWDGMVLQYSLNGGSTWTNVGAFGDPVNCLNQNWFNYNNITWLNSLPAGTRHGWSGRAGATSGSCGGGSGSNGWLTATHCLTGLANKPNVRFRFLMGSGTTCNSFDGMAIDDILIQNAAPNSANFSFSCAGSNVVNFTNTSLQCPTGYAWNFGDPSSGAANTSTLTNPSHTFSAPGIYTVSLTSNGPCNAAGTTSYTLSILSLSTTAANVSCNGAANGSATATAMGAGLFSYAWLPGGQTTSSVTGLAPGTYTVNASSGTGCPASALVNISQPAPLALTMAQQSVSCNGASNGAATVTASGGTSAYTYTWLPSGGNAFIASGLAAGNYTVTVKDANNCTKTASAAIAEPASMTLSINSSGALCGSSNGSATVSVTGGAAAYSYSWTPSGGTAPVASGLSVGVYSAIVTDANGCSKAISANITSTGGPTVVTTATNVSCNGAANGIISSSVSGGTPGYTYSWSPAVGAGSVASGLSAGLYSLTVTDAGGCMGAMVTAITQPAPLIAITSVTNATCYGTNSGMASANPVGGTPAYTYSWLPSGGNTASAGNLAAGIYSVITKDINNCTATGTVLVSQPTALSPVITFTNISCTGGGNNGAASVNVSGGTPAYSYSWAPSGAIGSTAAGLAATTHTVTVKDLNSCSVSATVSISSPSSMTLAVASTSLTCNGVNNGSATLTVSGGTPNYSYSWLPSAASGPVASALAAGTYTASVTDASGCSQSLLVNLAQPTSVQLSSNTTNSAACVGTAILLNGSASGGTGPYTYSWSPGPAGNSYTVSETVAGTYEYVLTGTDARNCIGTQTISLTFNHQPTLTVNNPTICAGEVAVLTAQGATTYSWQPGNITGNTFTYNGISNASVSLTGAHNGCVSQATAAIFVNPRPTSSLISDSKSGCLPACISFSCTASSTVGAIAWNFGNGTAVSTSSTVQNCYTAPGNYTVTSYLTDNNGCHASSSYTLQFYPRPVADFNYEPYLPSVDEEVQFVDASYGSAAVKWDWYFKALPAPNAGAQNPSYAYDEAGVYVVALVITDQRGCYDTITKNITVSDDWNIYVPNAFTPNGDGLNDSFQPKGSGIINYELRIFNRWGGELMFTKDMNEGWNGMYGNKLAPGDVYVWKIHLTNANGVAKELTGRVTLLR